MSRTNEHWEKAKVLSEQYYERLHIYVYNLTKDQELTMEIVDAVFYKIYMNEQICQRIKEPAWGYLAQTAMREWLMIMRKATSDKRTLGGYGAQAERWQDSHEEAMINQELMAQLNERVRHLPPRMREAFELLREGYTTGEVAEKMGIDEQTVRNMKTKAIYILRDELTRLGLLQLLWLLW